MLTSKTNRYLAEFRKGEWDMSPDLVAALVIILLTIIATPIR